MTRTKNAWINLLFLIVTLAVNTMGALGFINGMSQKEISDKYLTLITPSPSTFTIWSVIYTLLIISLILMIVKKNDYYYQCAIDEITVLYRISCILNIAWIVLFSYLLVEVSLVFIFGFVIALAILSERLVNIHEKNRWLLPLTFGLYTGWLVIAAVVNTAAALVKNEWKGFGISEEIWAVIVLVIAIVIIGLVMVRLRNAVFPLPAAWAYFGINQFLKSSQGFNGAYGLLETVSLAGMLVLIVLAGIQFYQNGFLVVSRRII